MHIMVGSRNGDVPANRDAVLDALTRDRANPASVVSCLARAREGARAVRDVISAEMWEAINTTPLRLRDGDLSSPDARLHAGAYSIYQHVKGALGAVLGLTARTMLCDEASAFLFAGGRIESGDMVLRMLRVTLPVGDTRDRADGQAIALLRRSAAFRPTAARCPRPPTPSRSRASCCSSGA